MSRYPRVPLGVYLDARIDKNADGHWYWLGQVQTATTKRPTLGGYGFVNHWSIGKAALAHRVAYEFFVGPIPERYQIDHLCRVRLCVNPEHLEAVTQRENIRRQPNVLAQLARTHCPAGHPLEGDNLRVRGPGGRSCRTCDRDSAARSNARRRAAKLADRGAA